MTERTTAVTGTAGEHFVAYCLAKRGLLPALTRGGSPSVDILVASQDGGSTVAIQVKTSSWARREYKRKKETNYWLWDVGAKALTRKGERLLYAFVDLRDGAPDNCGPTVFIVPSEKVCEQIKPEHTRYMFWIPEGQEAQYKERWDLITDLLE
jgi:hypothetical protein